MAELHDLLHNLPQELFDKIYDLTFAVDPTTTFGVAWSYKPPVQRQIDRATRADFAKLYFASEAGFRIENERDTSSSCRTLFRWLSNLPASHQRRINRIDVANLPHFTNNYDPRRVKKFLEILNKVAAEKRNVHLKSGSVLQVDFVNNDSGEETRMSAEGPMVKQ